MDPHAEGLSADDVRAEIRSLRVILRRVEKLSPASRRWLIERLAGENLGDGSVGEPSGVGDGAQC